MRNLLSWARCLLIYWPFILLLTLILEPVSLLAGVIDRSGRARHAVARAWAAVALWLVAQASVSGRERIDASRPRVYAANHLSALDIPLLYRYLPLQFRIMAHRLVFRVPLIGWWLRGSGSLEIAPESVALSRRALHEAVKTLQAGISVAIFPEGERAPKGEMLKFRRGAFYVAVKAQADVVPMAILGTHEALPLGSAHIRKRRLRLIIGEPIAVAGYTLKDLDALAEKTQQAVTTLLHHRDTENTEAHRVK
ncbi:MAG: lysophospholipid acyltransferase family protein [Terriglobales bacterium]